MTRLRKVSAQDAGWRRVRCGRGFRYLDAVGGPLNGTDVQRIRELVIPPAWRDVWICADERGHLQAVGIDDAGRKQYLYHPEWRAKRDALKFERMLDLAGRLPAVRHQVLATLRTPDTDREHVLATAVRLIDVGCFRLGSEEYAEDNGSYGLTTLERGHVRRNGPARVFEFVGKSGIEHEVSVTDPLLGKAIDALTVGRRAHARLLCARDGRRWVPVTAAEVNDHIRRLFGLDVTAKDFRTWHGTVEAAAVLASAPPAAAKTARARQVRAAIAAVSELLGNTPAVARSSYVDPRVVDLWEEGHTIESTVRRLPKDPVKAQDRLDRAVLRLLS
jgi:DNA topoisomerase I